MHAGLLSAKRLPPLAGWAKEDKRLKKSREMFSHADRLHDVCGTSACEYRRILLQRRSIRRSKRKDL